MERSILNYHKKDRIRTKAIKTKVKLNTNIIYYTMRMKWSRASHVGNMTDERWASKLTFWYLTQHNKKRGRQRARWTDDFDFFLKHKLFQRITGE